MDIHAQPDIENLAEPFVLGRFGQQGLELAADLLLKFKWALSIARSTALSGVSWKCGQS